MAYRKRYGRGRPYRRRFKRRGYKRSYRYRRSGLMGRFSGTMAQPRRPELKTIEMSDVGETLSVGGAFIFTSLNTIAQGVVSNQRIGVKVTIRSIQLSMGVKKDTTAGGTMQFTTQRVRCALVVDKQCNGAAAILDDVYGPTVDHFREIANYSRYSVLKEWHIVLQCTAGAGDGAANDAGEVMKWYKFYKKCSIPIEFQGATGAITEITSNNIFFAVWAESVNPLCTWTGRIRLRYSDN